MLGVWLARWLRRAAPLRHALEPAAAAHELPLREQPCAPVGVREGGGCVGLRLRRGRDDLSGPAGSRDGDGGRRARGAHRERDGRRRRGDRPTISPADVRRTWGIAPGAPLVLYTGTFEPYQGLEMLLDAAAILAGTHPDAQLLVVGGRPEQVDAARAAAGRGAPAIFTGYQPAREIPAFVEAADILASPRIAGTNTPLKIYSYLRGGKAHRRDRSADAHAGARSRDGAARAPEPARVCRGARAAHRRSRSARPACRAPRASARERRYSREVYVLAHAGRCATG